MHPINQAAIAVARRCSPSSVIVPFIVCAAQHVECSSALVYGPCHSIPCRWQLLVLNTNDGCPNTHAHFISWERVRECVYVCVCAFMGYWRLLQQRPIALMKFMKGIFHLFAAFLFAASDYLVLLHYVRSRTEPWLLSYLCLTVIVVFHSVNRSNGIEMIWRSGSMDMGAICFMQYFLLRQFRKGPGVGAAYLVGGQK